MNIELRHSVKGTFGEVEANETTYSLDEYTVKKALGALRQDRNAVLWIMNLTEGTISNGNIDIESASNMSIHWESYADYDEKVATVRVYGGNYTSYRELRTSWGKARGLFKNAIELGSRKEKVRVDELL